MTDSEKLDEVIKSLERIEKALKIKPLSLWDNLKPM